VRTEPVKKTRCSAPSALPSIAEMRTALDAKGILLKDTTLKGTDLEVMIRLPYRNMATSLAELRGIDTKRHRIDTSDSLPVRKRAHRHTPADKEEISRQTRDARHGNY
jgi:hypothetical protein